MSTLDPVRTDITRVSKALVQAAAQYQSAILADVSGRRGALDASIAPLARHMKVAGPAFTVEVRPGDNLMFHAALALAKPGDVIVVDGKGDGTSALCGAIMSAEAQASGIAGFVVYGAARDTEELSEGQFPIFATGANPNGPTRGLAGRINWPVSLGGVTINPGDLIVGDSDGVVVIPKETAEEVVGLAAEKTAAEAERFKQIASGNVHPAWLDAALIAAGIHIGVHA